MDASEHISPQIVDGWARALAPVRRYHQHRVEDGAPTQRGPCTAGHPPQPRHLRWLHVRDGRLREIGRLPTALGDDLIFKVPMLGNFARQSGIHPASPKAGYALLKAGRMLFVSPGGMWSPCARVKRRGACDGRAPWLLPAGLACAGSARLHRVPGSRRHLHRAQEPPH